MSSKNGHFHVVEYLISIGANVNALNDEALINSAIGGHVEVVKILIENEAHLHVNNNQPLLESLSRDHTDVINYLLSVYSDKGLKKMINNNDQIKNLLIKFIMKPDLSKCERMINIFRESGIDIFDMTEKELIHY